MRVSESLSDGVSQSLPDVPLVAELHDGHDSDSEPDADADALLSHALDE